MVKLCYIAGPYRANTLNEIRRNIRAAERASEAAVRLGFYPVSPHACTAFFDAPDRIRLWLEGGIEALKRCDAIMLCPGWRDSEGTMAELAEAKRRGMPVYLHHEKITSDIGLAFRGDAARGFDTYYPIQGVDCAKCGRRQPSPEMTVTDSEGPWCRECINKKLAQTPFEEGMPAVSETTHGTRPAEREGPKQTDEVGAVANG